jgi:hypothetical protein
MRGMRKQGTLRTGATHLSGAIRLARFSRLAEEFGGGRNIES